jgi:hypothetical protein
MRSLVFLAPLLLGCAAEEAFEAGDLEDAPDASWDGKADGSRIAVTASSVEALDGDLSSVTPPCRTADAWHSCEYYLSPSSALGDYGPLGAYGPLGSLGPLGTNAWNSSYWISAVGDWSEWSDEMTEHGGPLSASGPLGPDGPLSDRAYYETLPAINDWAKQLQAGGVWTVLGPLGPLGALGPLGPLGPVGAHGFAPDRGGRFMNGDRVVRTIRTSYAAEPFELVEMYDEDTARTVAPDTSFVALGELPRGGVDQFPAKSLRDQFVTVLVVPEKQLDDFDLVIKDATGRVIAQSSSASYIDWIQLQAPRGGRMTIEVSLAASGHWLGKTYRLYVIGAGSRFNATDITGDHQLAL